MWSFYKDIVFGRATFISVRDAEGLFLRQFAPRNSIGAPPNRIIYMPTLRPSLLCIMFVGRFDRARPVGKDANRNALYMIAPFEARPAFFFPLDREATGYLKRRKHEAELFDDHAEHIRADNFMPRWTKPIHLAPPPSP